jgi:hypothetical protein
MLNGNHRFYYSSFYCIESSLIDPTALTAKNNLVNIDNDDDDELQNDKNKDEILWMSDTLAGMMV